jgi:hypothetical protein
VRTWFRDLHIFAPGIGTSLYAVERRWPVLLIATLFAMLIIWGLGAFNMWGLEAHRNIVLIFLGIAAVLQLGIRARTRPH